MTTTIAISPETRDQIKDFGNKGETYEEILLRLLRCAKERQLQELLMDTSDASPVSEALARAEKKWRK